MDILEKLSLGCWVLVGVVNAIRYLYHERCNWFDYWLAYTAVILLFILELR